MNKPTVYWEDSGPVGCTLPDGVIVKKSSPCTHRWAASARGWLRNGSERAMGSYMDYGNDHFRPGHDCCKAGECKCKLSQPGKVHAVAYTGGPPWPARYFPTTIEARAWVEAQVRAAGLWPAEASLKESGATYCARPKRDRQEIARPAGWWLDGVWLGPTAAEAVRARDGA